MRSGESFSEAEVVDVWRGLFKILLRDANIYSKRYNFFFIMILMNFRTPFLGTDAPLV